VTRLTTRLTTRAPKIGRRLAEDITAALSEQTVTVVGTSAAAMVLPRPAEQLATLRRQRAEVAVEVEVGTCARLLTEVSGRHFDTAGYLAAYAGVPPSPEGRGPQSMVSTTHAAATRY
jgi:hypothetical protein